MRPPPAPPQPNAYRRCHRCDAVSSRRLAPDEAIGRCAGCRGPFAPFFYFDDKIIPIYDEAGGRPATGSLAPEAGAWRGIRGLTAHWPDEP